MSVMSAPLFVTKMADWLKSACKRLFEDGSGQMQISQGKIHEWLGVTLGVAVPRKVKITMIPHVKEIVKPFSKHDNSKSIAATPATEHLFKVNDNAKSLTEGQMIVCHNFVAKCLFLTKQARPDVSTDMAFLSARVKSSDVDKWKKLTRMIRHLHRSIEMPLILHTDSVPVPKCWVDGSHAAHPNISGHSGGCMSLGKGVPMNTSAKQKLNTQSSAETDSLLPMLSCPSCSGPTTAFSKRKDLVIKTPFCVKTTKA
jgi:hypothetical protein